jgi:hypothetical protein
VTIYKEIVKFVAMGMRLWAVVYFPLIVVAAAARKAPGHHAASASVCRILREKAALIMNVPNDAIYTSAF